MAIINNKKLADELIRILQDTVNVPSTISPASSLWNIPSNSPCPVETDEQGNIYAYKVLIWNYREGFFSSPVYPAAWVNGILESDDLPRDVVATPFQRHGIYFMKSVNDPEIADYYCQFESRVRARNDFYYNDRQEVFIVRCVISGVIIEAERGFRSQYAKIEGVLNHGNWQPYQDFYYEAQHYARRRDEPWREAQYTDEWRTYIAGDWNTSSKLASQDEDPEEGGS